MNRYIKILTIVFSLSFLWGCLEDPEVYKVTVKTDSIVEFVQGGVSVSGGIYTENEEYQPTIESCGFCYGVAEGPTLSNFVVKVKKSGIGDFNATLKSLDEGTKYYVRAFAQNKYGVVYGEEVSFVSLTKPAVKTLSLLEENEKLQLIVNCELESLGSGDITELGVCYSTENKLPNKNNDVYKLVSNIQKGKYTISIPVEPNVKYYVRAFASNLAGVAYGEVKEIITTEAIYTIKFDGNGGVGSMEEIYTTPSKEVQLISNSFTRIGYTFIGWNTEVDGSGTTYYNEQNISIDSDLTLYAQWTPIYTITFNANGGSGSMSSETVSSGSSVSLPANTFTRSGYEFVGWNTNADGSGVPYTNGQRITPSRNITLYAQWNKNEVYYTISFNSNGGSGTMYSTEVQEGVNYTLPANTFSRTGYTFIGWNTNVNGNGTSYNDKHTIMVRGNLTLYAQWKKIEVYYTITFNANGGSGSMSSQTVSAGTSFYLPINTFTRSGYEFVGWNTNADASGVSYTNGQNITPSGDMTLYAQWKKKEVYYTITFDSNGGSGSMSSKTVSAGSTVSLPENTFTRSGFEFIGWNTNSDGNGTSYTDGQTITPFGDISLYAQWKKIENNQEQTSGSHQGHDYVDLGLPSGTLWATCNVGATKPEEHGDYFAWGEIKQKSNYSWSTYTWCNGSYDTQTKYCTDSSYGKVDNQTALILNDDAANANWSGSWRMPTKEEQTELRNSVYTRWAWTTLNGVNGYIVMSNVNGNSIFLPAAGYHYNYSPSIDAGSAGYYWSSSLYVSISCYASVLSFSSNYIYNSDTGNRNYGFSVRPVLSQNSSVEPEQPTLYTITFNANGGSGSMSLMTVNAGSSITLPSNKFTQSGYSFTGWNTEVDGSGVSYTNGQSLTLSDDLTLYAQWKRYVSTITFDANDGSGESSSIDVSRSEKVILLNKFVRDGYVFLNWNTEADGSGLSFENAEEIMVAGDLTLYAQWRKYDTPTVTTSNVTDITNNSASCGGSIISLDYEIIERGICYSSSSTPTISNYVIKSGEGVGAFTCSLTALSSGTTYYVRAYAKYASDVVVYGQTKTFKTFKVPTLSSPSITEKEDGTVVCGSSVSTIGYNVTERGICYATYSTPTTSSTLVKSTTNGTGSFECILINLVAGTTYYVRAYAKYDNGNVAYSSTISFITHKSPQVTTSTVSNISSTSAICGGTITSPDYSIQERGICYSKTSTPTISNSVIKGGAGTGTFYCTLTGLSSGSIYYVRAYAKYADDKVIYGETRSFTTQRIPVISSFTISNIGETSADCNAYVNSYDYTITERGFCYSTYSNPTINDYKVSSTSGNGTYTGILSSLNRNTTYYVRAYAVYNGNIIYSDVQSFKTFYTLKLTTLEVTDITEDYVVLEGDIICPGMTISKRGFDYWTSTNPKVNTISCGSGEGEFGIKWEFFMANTTYYVRAYAIIDGIKSYGNTQMFNTLPTNIDYPNGSKLYFINTAGWENVYAYVWKERGISSGTSGIDLGVNPWPGKPATYEGTFRGYQIYSYDIVGLDVNSIIFCQPERYQTEDLEIDLYKIYYYLGEWYESINDIP